MALEQFTTAIYSDMVWRSIKPIVYIFGGIVSLLTFEIIFNR